MDREDTRIRPSLRQFVKNTGGKNINLLKGPQGIQYAN